MADSSPITTGPVPEGLEKGSHSFAPNNPTPLAFPNFGGWRPWVDLRPTSPKPRLSVSASGTLKLRRNGLSWTLYQADAENEYLDRLFELFRGRNVRITVESLD